MTDQIIQLVKEQLAKDPRVSSEVPEDKKNAVHQAVAASIEDGLKNRLSGSAGGGIGGMLSSISGGGSGGLTAGITQALTSRLAGLGLPHSAISAITGSLPGLVEKISSRGSSLF